MKVVSHKHYFIFPSEWLTPQIVKALGSRIWLLLYFMDKITHCAGGIGLVLGGQPLSFEDIAAELQIHRNTVALQYADLEKFGFVGSKKVWGGPRKFFVLGYSKFREKRQSPDDERRFAFAHSVIQTQIQMWDNETAKNILNPNYQKVLFNLSGNVSKPPNSSDTVNKIDEPITNIGASISDKKAREKSSKQKGKGKERKRDNPKSSGSTEGFPLEGNHVYSRYM